jgi:glc operon protein GlcG
MLWQFNPDPSMRTKPSLTAADAELMLVAAKAEAARRGWKVSIAVVDDAGFLLRLERLDGAGLQSPEVATMKARSAALSRLPTKRLEEITKERNAMLRFPDRLAIQGGLPIMHEGECVGGIGVSGVQSHEDEDVAAAGLAALA